ncbi:MAG: glycosyltransferase [Bacteroidetes bacterium]|nr:glycosyltransferase [Bacteroidota bacterium]
MSSVLEIIFWVLTAIYLLESLRILSGLKKQAVSRVVEREKKSVDGISLIIPVRNEISNLKNLILNLEAMKRPNCGFEVIFVDDHSDDGSELLLNQFTIDFEWVKVSRMKDESGKPFALDTGIQNSSFSIIVTTDADMVLNPDWITFLEDRFKENASLAMVCGPTVSDSTGFLGAVQETDWFYMMAIASGSHHSGHPFTAIGNNMAFLKKDYLELGGFRSLPFTITEDFALFRLFLNSGKAVIFSSTPQNIHITRSNQSWPELVLQRKRWILGGVKSPVRSWLLVISAVGLHLSVIFGWILNPWLTIISAVVKLSADFFLIRQFARQTEIIFKPKAFVLYELVYPLINLSIPIMTLFSRKVKWKGREYFEPRSR